METVLPFDIGGTSIRAGLFDRYAQPVKQVFRSSPPAEIKENAAEISAEAWWSAIFELAKELFSEKENNIAAVIYAIGMLVEIFGEIQPIRIYLMIIKYISSNM